jgi:hypothetical protein
MWDRFRTQLFGRATNLEPSRIEKRIRSASLLVGSGLLVQMISLTNIHPLAFMVFLAIGCPLVIAGIVVYLLSLPQE